MDFKFNVNNYVKVKLTDYGISVLKKQHDKLNEQIKQYGGKGLGEFKIEVDDEGYTKFQLHQLMNSLGHVTTMAHELPFDPNIIVLDGEPI